MSKTLTAIYEDGVFKPLEPVALAERQQVVVSVPEVGDGEDRAAHSTATPALPRNGAELVAYWRKEGVVGSRSDIADSVAHAQALRRSAQKR